MKRWHPLLRLVNPTSLTFHSATTATKALPASTFLVPSHELAFAVRWKRLNWVLATGFESIPMLAGAEETFAFSECLVRAAGKKKRLRFQVVDEQLEGGEALCTEIQENAIATHLAQLPSVDLTRSRCGAYLFVSLVAK